MHKTRKAATSFCYKSLLTASTRRAAEYDTIIVVSTAAIIVIIGSCSRSNYSTMNKSRRFGQKLETICSRLFAVRLPFRNS